MTTRRPRPQAPPLAVTLRAALAQGWHTLDALESLAGRATGARLRVHAALGELRAAGCVLEERVERGVAEVRMGAATGPDHPTLREPSPPVEGEPVDAASYYLGRGRSEEDADLDAVRAARGRDLRNRVIASLPPGATPREIMFAEAAEIVRMRGPVEPATAFDAPALPCEPLGPAEAADGPGEAPRAPILAALSVLRCDRVSPPGEWERLRCERYGCDGAHEARDGEAVRRWTDAPAPTEAERRAAGEEAEAAACARIAALPKGRGPGSRCANCDATRAKHEAGKGCGAWAEKPRGRPRVAPAAPSPTLDAPQPTTDARAVYEAIKAAGNVRVVAADGSPGNASEAALYAAAPDAAEEARRMVPMGGGAEPETTRGGSEETSDDATRDTDSDRPGACRRVPRPPTHVDGQPGVPSAVEDQAPPVARPTRAKRAAPEDRVGVAGRCRPPQCHADDIHEPARVRGFARPLCERHRRWVEEAGGTVGAGARALDVIH